MKKQSSLLRSVCLLGLVVFLALLGALVFLSVYGGIPFFSPAGFGISSFSQALEAYDQQNKESLSVRQHNRLLDSLEKKAVDTENMLSVLKRRRFLALHSTNDREQYISSHVEAAARARELYPHSAQIGAVAAEALIMNGFSGEGEIAADIVELASLMSEGALTNAALAFFVYGGAMRDPAEARLLPRELFTLLCSLFLNEEREMYLVNSCIRTILEGTSVEAFAAVNGLFEDAPLRDETIRFGAEFFYDYRNFLRSAELFSSFTDSKSLARQADALWLAGFNDSARGLWRTAAVETGNVAGGDEAEFSAIRARAFYNLGSTSTDQQEAGQYLERLFAANSDYRQGRVFGVVRYSRLAPADRAIAILNQAEPENEGLLDLELLRRRSEDWEINKTLAETWMLLNRHTADGRLFEWAAWYFDFQHRYEETSLALRNAGINRVEGPWSALHRAYALVREKNYGEAEKVLRSIVRSPGEATYAPGRRTQPLWQAGANLALLLEKQGKAEEALQYYEIAAGQLMGLIAAGEVQTAARQATNGEPAPNSEPGTIAPNPRGLPAAGASPERRDAAKIQLCIARVLRSLGKTSDSARTLDYALDLDPENLEARLEKRRLDLERGL
jgi:tetratricopeptide (TPR) repeat protein